MEHETFPWLVPKPDRPRAKVLTSSPLLEEWPNHVLGGMFQATKSMSPFHIWRDEDAFARHVLNTDETARRFTAIIEADRPVRLLLDVDLSREDLSSEQKWPSADQVWSSVTTLLQRYLDIVTTRDINVHSECWTFASHRDDKISFHLYFPGLVFSEVKQLNLLITRGFHRFLLERIRAHDPVALPLARKPTSKGQARTAVDHLVYQCRRHMRVALCHKVGKPNLLYDQSRHPRGRALPSLEEQLKACLPHPSGPVRVLPELQAKLVMQPSAFLWAGQAQPDGQPGAQQSYDAFMAPLEMLNPITRTYTAKRFHSLQEVKTANPVCVRYHGVLDLDVAFKNRERHQAYLDHLRRLQTPFCAADVPFPEFQGLLKVVSRLQEELPRCWCYFSGSGFRVLFYDETLWSQQRFRKQGGGGLKVQAFLKRWAGAVTPYLDSTPYKSNCGTKADLRASSKTGLWPQLVGTSLVLSRTEDPATSRTIRRFWAALATVAEEKLEMAQLAEHKRVPEIMPRPVHSTTTTEFITKALRTQGDRHSTLSLLRPGVWYGRIAREHRPRKCLATEREHKSNNFQVEQDGGDLWYHCLSKRCPQRVLLARVPGWRPPVNDWRVKYEKNFDPREVLQLVTSVDKRLQEARKLVMAYLHRYFARVGADSGLLYAQRMAPRGFRLFNRQNLLNVLEACQFTLTDADGKPKRVHFGQLWLRDPSAPAFDRMVFNPRPYGAPREASPGAATACEFNTYTGPDISRYDASSADVRAAQPVLDHIRRIWCRDDEVVYTYVLNWLASVVQRPWHKLGVAILLQGEQGSGKGCVVEFIKKILGDSFKAIHRPDEVLGSFNTALLGTSLLFLDEMFWGGDKKLAGSWKALITEDVHQINQKYLPVISQRSCHNVIVASNNAHLAPVELKDRRSLVLSVANTYAGTQDATKRAYFQELRGVPAKAVARVLYTRDLRGWNSRNIPHTDAIQAQQEQTLDCVHRWWLKVITDGFMEETGVDGRATLRVDNSTEVNKAFVFSCYQRCPMVIARFSNDAHFWRTMKALVPDVSFRRPQEADARTRLAVFPPLPRLQDHWRTHAGGHWRFPHD